MADNGAFSSAVYRYRPRRCPHAPVLCTDWRIAGGREGFFRWLRDILNKNLPTGSKSAEADAARRRERPGAAVTERSADAVNKKCANFDATRWTARYESGKSSAAKRVAQSHGRLGAMQQLAIHVSSLRSRRSIGAEGAAGRGTDSHDSSWLASDRAHHRAESSSSAIDLAVREDLDALAHHRHYYTSPRHCYRLPPRVKLPTLGSHALNKSIGVPTRAIADFAPRNTKPPIREPNMPEKRDRKDEKKDRKEKKKPILRTNPGSADNSESQAAMLATDSSSGDPNTAFRYNWGVKLPEESAEAHDKPAEKDRRQVTKQLWGVKLQQPKLDNDATDSERSSAAASYEARSQVVTSGSSKLKASSLKGTTADYLSIPSSRTDLIAPNSDSLATERQETTGVSSAENSDTFRRVMRSSPNMLRETIVVDDEYNVPEEAVADAEISAWRNLAERSNAVIAEREDFISAGHLDMLSIRPEAPQPKVDVQVVRSSTDDSFKESETQPSFPYRTSRPASKRPSPVATQKLDSYLSSKKLHTASLRARYESPLVSVASVDRATEYSRFAPAFSTSPEGTKREDQAIGDASIQREKRRTDSRNIDDKRFEEARSNTANATERSLLPAKSRALVSDNREQADVKVDRARTSSAVAVKETEFSASESRGADRKSAPRPSTTSAESALDKSYDKRDESFAQSERNRLESSRNSYDCVSSRDEGMTYDDRRDTRSSGSSHSSRSSKSNAIGRSKVRSVKENPKSTVQNAESVNVDPKVEDLNDNASEGYVDDGDYVRIGSDPYPYSKEHLNKWRMERYGGIYKPLKRTKSRSAARRSTPKNADDTDGESYDSHAHAGMKTSGSGGGGGGGDDGTSTKTTRRASDFRVSSARDQRVVSDCLYGDAADALGMQQWTYAFSRLDDAVGATVSGKMNEETRGDNESLRAHHYW